MSGNVELIVHVGLDKNLADFMVHTDTVPGMYEPVEVTINGQTQRCIVEDRQWKYKIIGGQVVSSVCHLYLSEKK